ncbi:phosphohydrolase [Streptomyces tailanensis]|uniref:phosphohydrolase n=1 Tax=Streptomyces tailanensis TaxID=2569858 RepID=UPI00122DD395
MPSATHALTYDGDPPLRPLPERAVELLRVLAAPPRLVAHLRLVHDVAYELADWMEQRYPELSFDRAAVLFGAATHDIGKTAYVGELSGPGSAHEEAGRRLLLEHGVAPEWAGGAGESRAVPAPAASAAGVTAGACPRRAGRRPSMGVPPLERSREWGSVPGAAGAVRDSPAPPGFAGTHAAWAEPGVGVGDLLVSLADKVWKNKRVAELENLVVERLAEASGRPAWEEFLALDDLLGALGADADRRLAFQAAYPVLP